MPKIFRGPVHRLRAEGHGPILLDKGLIYSEILEKTGASSATISRVNRCLHYGAGGYQAVVPRLREETV